jgi:hypothetical protein
MNDPHLKKLSPRLKEEIEYFFTNHPAARVSRHLRRMLLDYLRHGLDSEIVTDVSSLLWDMYYLFELLDLAERETHNWLDPKDFT